MLAELPAAEGTAAAFCQPQLAELRSHDYRERSSGFPVTRTFFNWVVPNAPERLDTYCQGSFHGAQAGERVWECLTSELSSTCSSRIPTFQSGGSSYLDILFMLSLKQFISPKVYFSCLNSGLLHILKTLRQVRLE